MIKLLIIFLAIIFFWLSWILLYKRITENMTKRKIQLGTVVKKKKIKVK